jgi:hypothetical protein
MNSGPNKRINRSAHNGLVRLLSGLTCAPGYACRSAATIGARMNKLLPLLVLMLLVPGLSSGLSLAQSTVSKGPESTYFGVYKPRAPRSFADLPAPLQETLRTHLIERLGAEVFSRLEFSGGQVVNFDELFRLEPEARNWKWRIFTYGLTFKLSNPALGIKAYHARILLGQNGEVIQEIDLPRSASDPAKARLVSLNSARRIARTRGFPSRGVDVSLFYRSDLDSLVWSFAYKLRGDRYTWVERELQVNAHTGEVILQGDSDRFF